MLKKKKRKIAGQKIYNFIISIPIVGVLVVTILGFFGSSWWIFDLLAHFRAQYLLIIPFLILLSLFSKNKNLIFIPFFSLLINLLVSNPLLIPNINKLNQQPNVKIIFTNININHKNPNQIIKFLKAENADVVGISEITEKKYLKITTALPEYKYHFHQGKGVFGIALLSRQPLVKKFQVIDSNSPLPSIKGNIIISGREIQIIVTHPFPPISPQMDKMRNQQLSAISAHHIDHSIPTILMGDLNSTPWSYPYLQLIKQTKLSNTRNGFGINGSWPTKLPSPLKIPIDHILVSDEFTTTDFRIGKNIDSDHMPVVAELKI